MTSNATDAQCWIDDGYEKEMDQNQRKLRREHHKASQESI